ncbi:hypothetical protein SCA6_017237 [Theobroma cacao]
METLTKQELISKTRKTFDRALCALLVTQHDRIWQPYLVFVSQKVSPLRRHLGFTGGMILVILRILLSFW